MPALEYWIVAKSEYPLLLIEEPAIATSPFVFTASATDRSSRFAGPLYRLVQRATPAEEYLSVKKSTPLPGAKELPVTKTFPFASVLTATAMSSALLEKCRTHSSAAVATEATSPSAPAKINVNVESERKKTLLPFLLGIRIGWQIAPGGFIQENSSPRQNATTEVFAYRQRLLLETSAIHTLVPIPKFFRQN